MIEPFRHPYCLVRSQRKTLALEIRPGGGLLVRAPKRLALSEIERFISSKSDWICKHQQAVKPALPQMGPQDEMKLREAAARQLPELVERFASRMGLRPARVRITSARKRLGSCSAKGSLCFSFRLMAYPRAVIEYVMVHELAHLAHLNHSADFYKVVEREMPDFRERIKTLKQFTPGC